MISIYREKKNDRSSYYYKYTNDHDIMIYQFIGSIFTIFICGSSGGNFLTLARLFLPPAGVRWGGGGRGGESEPSSP